MTSPEPALQPGAQPSVSASRLIPPSLRFAAGSNNAKAGAGGMHQQQNSFEIDDPTSTPAAVVGTATGADETVESPLDLEHAVPEVPMHRAPPPPPPPPPHPEDPKHNINITTTPASSASPTRHHVNPNVNVKVGGAARRTQDADPTDSDSEDDGSDFPTVRVGTTTSSQQRHGAAGAGGDLSAGEEGGEELWVRRSWLRDFAMDNFQCTCCRRLAIDPVMVDEQELVCRRCYTNELASKIPKESVADVPAFIARAVLQLRSGLTSALLLSEAQEQERVRNQPKLDINKALQIASAEQSHRDDISLQCEHIFEEIKRRHHVRLRSRMPGTSRQLKSEGDKKYEAQDYAAAYEQYSRAIEVDDKTQQLSGMYANRSAALFMLMRFEECIADCQKALECDLNGGNNNNNNNTSSSSAIKMWARCQKAEVQLGNLSQALKYLDLIIDKNGGKATEEQQAERTRLSQGAERLAKLNNNNNNNNNAKPSTSAAAAATSRAEREDTYKLLMTRFPEAQHFRCMYCEQCLEAERYDEVINKFHQGMVRTPRAAFLLCKALYMTGFEEFARAKTEISEYAKHDAECRALQETIFKVDEHKQRGNELFSQKHFAESIQSYSAAIELASTNGRVLRVLYCNRAAAYKEVGRFAEGVEDCTKAISFDPKFCKAFARRARCLIGVQDLQSAMRDFKKACELEPTDNDLARELRNAERLANDEIVKEKDLYHVLGVSKNAPAAEIKSRYRELSLKYHPDKCMGLADIQRQEAERKFKIINEAYQTLSNQESRAKYDMQDATAAYRRHSAFGSAAHDLFRGGAHPNQRYTSNPYQAREPPRPSSFF